MKTHTHTLEHAHTNIPRKAGARCEAVSPERKETEITHCQHKGHRFKKQTNKAHCQVLKSMVKLTPPLQGGAVIT